MCYLIKFSCSVGGVSARVEGLALGSVLGVSENALHPPSPWLSRLPTRPSLRGG
jgi:hypothetical protein